jgi:hypothetical protein
MDKLATAEVRLLKRIAEAKDRTAICAILQGVVKAAIDPHKPRGVLLSAHRKG